jgi:LPS O-antigen subunit length determinant protein (WzzB/FepE family)
MSEDLKKYDDEIDLVEFFYTLWEGKWMILSIVAFSVFCVLGYLLTRPAPNFIATTEIQSLSSVQISEYAESNAFGFYELSEERLKNLYFEKIKINDFFEKAIKKNKLLDVESFETEANYDLAISNFASSINVKIEGKEKLNVGKFEAAYSDKEKWKAVLTDVNDEATAEVRRYLKDDFFTALAIEKRKRDFSIQDIRTQISNEFANYEFKANYRLAFLREQAAIARKLGVAKNTVGAQMFSSPNSLVTNIGGEVPFYLRGYEAIDKEIELIGLREDKKYFMGLSLLELESELRTLTQDKTLERAENLFALTPVMQGDNFSAVSLSIEDTEFKYTSKRNLMLVIAILMGGMLGVFYVLIAKVVRTRKLEIAKS